MKRFLIGFGGWMLAIAAWGAASEITVSLDLDNIDFVVGERMRGVVSIANVSPEFLQVGENGSPDRFLVEVFRASDRSQLEDIGELPFVAPFVLKPNEGIKLEIFLDDHYGLRGGGEFLAKPVLVHNGMRYEGRIRAFSVVPGRKICGALQLYANHPDCKREFSLVAWSRGGQDHLFLMAVDSGENPRYWNSVDLGQMMKITKPTVSILTNAKVVVIHRLDPDYFVRSEFWSVPKELKFFTRELIRDPETASSERIRELYRESGGIKPKENPWWKFW